MEKFDFVLIGSGITGLSLAEKLRNHGFTTLNIDKSMDLGFPLTGSMFISLKTYAEYFQKYEKFVTGIHSSVILKVDSSEEELTLPQEKKIVRMDREKLTKQIAANLVNNGGSIYIASTLASISRDADILNLTIKHEGKDETVRTGSVIDCTGAYNSVLMHHDTNCKNSSVHAVYSTEKLTKFPDETFIVDMEKKNFNIMAQYMGFMERLSIGEKKYDKVPSQASFSYNITTHDCFPASDSHVILSGNMLGTENYLGTGIGFAMHYNDLLIKMIEENNIDNDLLKEKYTLLRNENDYRLKDPVDSIFHRIPVYS